MTDEMESVKNGDSASANAVNVETCSNDESQKPILGGVLDDAVESERQGGTVETTQLEVAVEDADLRNTEMPTLKDASDQVNETNEQLENEEVLREAEVVASPDLEPDQSNNNQNDGHSRGSGYSCNSGDSYESSDSRSTCSDNYDSTNSSGRPNEFSASIAQQAIMNRFSSWRKQAVTTLQQTATTVSSSNVTSKRPSWSGFPLQSASLSPAVTPTNDNHLVSLPIVHVNLAVSGDSYAETATANSNLNGDEKIHQNQDRENGTDGSLEPVAVGPSSCTDPWADLPPAEGKSSSGSASHNLKPQIDVISRAAATVVDSVQTSYFRGRYAAKNANVQEQSSSNNSVGVIDSVFSGTSQLTRSSSSVSSATNQTNSAGGLHSQTARIMASPQAVHMQEVVQSLQPHEVVMLLGKGRLGVNLKQTYKKNKGVFVDFIVAGGAAQSAAVVSVGDILKQIGDDDTQIHGTIISVPHQIAKASRPVRLIFRSGTTDPSNISKINFIDVSVALMHELLQQNKDMEQLTEEPALSHGESSVPDHVFPNVDTLDAYTFPNSPSISIQKTFAAPSARRNTISSQYSANESSDDASAKEICQLAATNPKSFRLSLKSAFLLCCIDCRRVPYLRNHFSGNSLPVVAADFHMQAFANIQKGKNECDNIDVRQANMMLEFFLELLEFVEFYGITPASRVRATALEIAQKYLLPTNVVLNGLQTLTPPPMDLHSTVVSDSELRKLEAVLLSKESTVVCDIPRDVFWEFQQSCLDQLACGPVFANFMISVECARMRAYLRNTAPFVNVPLDTIVHEICRDGIRNIHAQNYIQYCILFLVSMTDKEVYGENDDLLDQNMKTVAKASPNKSSIAAKPTSGKSTSCDRIEDVANGLCAAIYIRSKLLPAAAKAKQFLETKSASDASDILVVLIELFEQLWEVFVAPNVGALAAAAASSTNEEDVLERLHRCRIVLQQVASTARAQNTFDIKSFNDSEAVCKLLLEDDVLDACSELADELVYDYAVNFHTKFRTHKFHEWMCEEFLIAKHYQSTDCDNPKVAVPALPHGCIKRLLRKADFPVGLSPHKPSHDLSFIGGRGAHSDHDVSTGAKLVQTNAECAVVFGSSVGVEFEAPVCPGLHPSHGDVRRFCCNSVSLPDESTHHESISLLQPVDVPSTLESYAIVSNSSDKPFGPCTNNIPVSSDGWKVFVINFIIPRAEASSSPNGSGDASLYGVSLVFQRHHAAELSHAPAEADAPVSFVCNPSGEINEEDRASPVDSNQQTEGSNSTSTREVQVSHPCPTFNQRMKERRWSQQIAQSAHLNSPPIIAIALTSQRNVILAMRQTLTMLLHDFCCSVSSGRNKKQMRCQGLVDILGNFSYADVESESLQCLLEPYLRRASTPWLERPIVAQRDEFVQSAGRQLIRSLPPIPLALMFVTALLEQKIVLSSSRRGMLLSATTALTELLKPLKWCHVMVPQVPSNLAADLLQYPAPFILGLCSEDPGVIDLIRNLSLDVTLVDLDVGRVILASSFAHDSELGRGTPNNAETARALRSQVLFLAQSLGTVFASNLDSESWCCDRPSAYTAVTESIRNNAIARVEPFDTLRGLSTDFIEELLAGTSSCCYWIEEAVPNECTSSTSNDPTVLFDEDRFFHIKNFRERDGGFESLFGSRGDRSTSNALALSLDSFDLVLELFLRCQSMNAYIGTRRRDEMVFSLQ